MKSPKLKIVKPNSKSKPVDYHRKYTGALKRKFAKLRKTRIGAILFLISGAIVFAFLYFGKIKASGTEVMRIIKSDKLIDKTMPAVSTNTIDTDSLFSHPYLFYNAKDGHLIEANESVDNISFANDEIYVTITTSTGSCGTRYIIQNVANKKDSIIHEILPARKMINTEPMNDYWRNRSEDDLDREEAQLAKEGRIIPDCSCDEAVDEMEFPMKYNLPGLQLKIHNNSQEAITIQGVELKVLKSMPNLYPYFNFGVSSRFRVPIFNEGWGAARNLRMHFNIITTDEVMNFKGPFKYDMKLEKLEPTDNPLHFYSYDTELSLKPYYEKEGVDVKALEALDYSIADRLKTLNKRGQLGRFKNGKSRVVGKLIFDGYTPQGSLRRDTIDFNFFQTMIVGEFGGEASAAYHTEHSIRLSPKGLNYKRNFDINNESIGAKSGGKFDIFMLCSQPSYHHFDLIIHYNNGKTLEINNLFFNYFIKKTEALSLKSKIIQEKKKIKGFAINEHN